MIQPAFADGNGDLPGFNSRYWYLPTFEIGPIKEVATTIGLNAYYLANMSESEYMGFQTDNLNRKVHACNVFVYTVLYSMGIARLNKIPYTMANFISRKLLNSTQFVEIDFDDLNQASLSPDYEWNIIMTRSRWPNHGHTVIPVGRTLDKDGNIDPKGGFIIAEGQYHEASHLLKRYSLDYIKKTHFRFFQYKPTADELLDDELNAPEASEQKKGFFKNLFKHRKDVLQAPVEIQPDSTDAPAGNPEKNQEEEDQNKAPADPEQKTKT